MALSIPIKSSLCIGKIIFNAALRDSLSLARIICRTAEILSEPKNICSVRQRPIPSAPNARAFCASSGVSAFARIFNLRKSSTQDIISSNSGGNSPSSVATSPSMTSPVFPSSEIISPSLTIISVPLEPTIFICLLAKSISKLVHPVTQHLPIPRATTAA